MSRGIRLALAHLAGDYVCQSDWMAQRKTQEWWPAIAHAATYTLPHLAVTRSPWRLAVIGGTHLVIDHWRLAKHVTWAKNQLAPAAYRPGHTPTGYSADAPDWLTNWLLFICDNTIHLTINVLATAGEDTP